MRESGELGVRDRAPGPSRSQGDPPLDDWVGRLTSAGPVRDEAIAALHELMLRAARYQVARMPEASGLGVARREEIVQSAADAATVSSLARLHTFEGRSRFTTWAFKFGILEAGVHVRRARWRGREVNIDEATEPVDPRASSPEAHAEGGELARAVWRGLTEALTPHQRSVAVALLIDEVPIDVLADRRGTTRGALYKTLHDARRRLRAHLVAQGYLLDAPLQEV